MITVQNLVELKDKLTQQPNPREYAILCPQRALHDIEHTLKEISLNIAVKPIPDEVLGKLSDPWQIWLVSTKLPTIELEENTNENQEHD